MSSGIFQLSFEKPIYDLEAQLEVLEAASEGKFGVSDQVRRMRREIDALKRKTYEKLTPWETVQVSRHPNRPQTSDYLDLMFDEFVELHGDHAFGDDRAIVCGFAKLGDHKVMLVGHQKGKNLKERNERLFGSAHPEGYRKALQKMRLAAKYRLPIVCLIDTPGAYPGIGAEERGQAHAIAVNIMEMSRLPTPIVCAVIGEGGSGGALGIGVGDRVCMMQFAYYSVISPEGCSGILWKDADANKEQAAASLRLTSGDLSKFGVIEDVVSEPLGGAHRDHRTTAWNLKSTLLRYLRELAPLSAEELVQQRHQRFRRIGVFEESVTAAVADNDD